MEMRVGRLAAALLVSVAVLGTSAARANLFLPPDGKVFAGVSNSAQDSDLSAFGARTGKHAAPIQTLTAWDYNSTRSLRTAASHRARVMVHISTGGGNGREAITPRAIA